MPARTQPSIAVNVPSSVRFVLWIDSLGGLIVGILMLVFAGWLSRLFQFPAWLYYFIATANLCYGTFSLVLALLRKRPVSLISTLAIANALWGCVCLITAANMIGHASAFGLAHILAECVVVFALARVEWRHRVWLAAM